jgi:cyanophycin synthetase
MSSDAPRARDGTKLEELRVLEGPNRFFTRPAVKLEFRGTTPGAAARVAARAGAVVRELHEALELPAPRLAFRRSADDLRAIVAYPWRRRIISQSIGSAAARVALGARRRRTELAGLRAVALGPLAHLPHVPIPIVAVTGTNGKSTTTRLIAHIAGSAGLRVGMTNSDGIYVRGELVEAGDWTGFGGAARVLAERDLDVAVLETARGGILLRGIGYGRNDVAVVTNISADHLGLNGIDTLDDLAEVKASIVRITKRDGWAVLNAEDERTWAMRRQTRAGIYVFSLDPSVAPVRRTLRRGGRAAVLRNGWLELHRGKRPIRLVEAVDLPVAFAGLSRYNVANALAAAAACDALGLTPRRIRAGLRSFALDEVTNPGRLNLFERDGRLVLIDFAHNEAGLRGLLEVSRQLAGAGRVLLALGTAGDRTDAILRGLGRVAGAGADVVVICQKEHYLRGRDAAEMAQLFIDGAAEAGMTPESIDVLPGEVESVTELARRARRGDVATLMSHADRPQVFAWLREHGFVPVDYPRLRQILSTVSGAARGPAA